MKKLVALLSIFTFVLFLTSCGGDEPVEEVIEEVVVDDPNAEITAADTSSTGVYQEEVSEEPQSLQEAMQGSNSEPEVEEGGMSFCDCVKKNKELQDIMMGENTSDEDFDKAMADIEAMKTGECKIMFAAKQNTMDEKKAHERKVRRCLSK
ncbi:MAG: hypothetical protein P1U41_01345 [Vicingaceae bacterium]|nr:hypothetical protein [Vicingaceae bacterium]